MAVFGQSGCNRAIVGVFRQNWLYSAKLLYSGKSCCIRVKVVVFGQSGCLGARIVVFG